MINLYANNSNSFKLEDAVLPRLFDTYVSRFNDVILRNIHTGYRINLGSLDAIYIDTLPATFEAIRHLAYNLSCDCVGSEIPSHFKIFDFTFANTFN